MRHFPLTFLVLVLGLRLTGYSQARPEPPPTATIPKANDATVVLSPAPPTAPVAPTPIRPRETSPDTAAKINASLPKFSPPQNAQNPEAKKTEERPDLREIDKPRNTIIRLPKYIVQERKEPAFKERELLTPKGKLELAYKRHPGLRFGSLPFFSNDGPALMMLEEEQRLERKAEMEDLYGLYKYSDPKAGAAVKRETNTTFIRHDGP